MSEERPISSILGSSFHLVMVVYNVVLLRKVRAVVSENSPVYDPNGEIPEYGGQFKYLTHINLWVQLTYFSLQLLTALLFLLSPSSALTDHAQSLLSFSFTTVIFPLACYVSVSFWAVSTYDTDLIYREVSQLLNHMTHSAIVVWVVLEVLLCRHKFPSLSVAMVPIFICCLMYILWVELIYARTGFWVYPIFNRLPQSRLYFTAFYSFSIFICFGLFLVGKAISNLV